MKIASFTALLCIALACMFDLLTTDIASIQGEGDRELVVAAMSQMRRRQWFLFTAAMACIVALTVIAVMS